MIPSQGTCLPCGFNPPSGCAQGAVNGCFSPSLSPSLLLPVKINKVFRKIKQHHQYSSRLHESLLQELQQTSAAPSNSFASWSTELSAHPFPHPFMSALSPPMGPGWPCDGQCCDGRRHTSCRASVAQWCPSCCVKMSGYPAEEISMSEVAQTLV